MPLLLVSLSSFPSPFAGKNVHVLIVSSWRSGSSFLGNIFNNHPDVFYMFEPGHPVWMKLLNESAELLHYPLRDLLRSLFTCDVSPLHSYLPQGGQKMSDFHYFAESRVLCMPPACQYSNMTKTYNRLNCSLVCGENPLKNIENVCRSHKHMAMKTVRILDLKVLIPLLQDPKLDLRIVHLVRDPRAVVSSRQYFTLIDDDRIVYRDGISDQGGNKSKTPNATEVMAKICRSQVSMYKEGRNSMHFPLGRYMLVRLEDLACDPLSKVNKVFSFVGLSMTPEIRHWVHNITHHEIASEPGGFMSYSKEAKNVTENWRKRLDFSIVKKIQSVCQEAMDMFGYLPLESEADLKDLDIVLVRKRKKPYR
ncbi:carbohydrate sulfotransferase 6-like [Pelobates cultripes]|uniref:Sulfotransferase n=1 Tax=Pelobates cultripes TaxID=61616 RepID=A0AAD1WMY8_PELCU|nr:carbohydrate sulfotransferase 6-like [Pelobates cultripes]